MIGSNVDLPIVGGSILSHDHFQGGEYEFAMAKAPYETEISLKKFPDIHAIVQKEIGFVFAKVLECAGVYKRTPEGQAALKKFLECI